MYDEYVKMKYAYLSCNSQIQLPPLYRVQYAVAGYP